MAPYANVLGLVGFGLTLFGLWQAFRQAQKAEARASEAKTSAELAKEAALSAVTKLSKYDALSELTRAKSVAEEIRRYQIRNFLISLPEGYNALASVLEEMESFTQALTSEEVTNLGRIINFARDKEEATLEAVQENKELNMAKLNKELAIWTRVLGGILGRLKKELEGSHESR